MVTEGHVSSSNDPVEAPAKEPPMATPSAVQVGEDERQSVPTRNILFDTHLPPILAALTFIEIMIEHI